jgi:hypothetical protein
MPWLDIGMLDIYGGGESLSIYLGSQSRFSLASPRLIWSNNEMIWCWCAMLSYPVKDLWWKHVITMTNQSLWKLEIGWSLRSLIYLTYLYRKCTVMVMWGGAMQLLWFRGEVTLRVFSSFYFVIARFCLYSWYVSNVSIIFDASCLFLHHLLSVSLHFVAFLCIFRN